MRVGDRISILNWTFVLTAFLIVGYAFSTILDSQTGNREVNITLTTPLETQVIEQGTRPSISQTASDLSTQDARTSLGNIESRTAPLPVPLMPVQASQEGPGTTDVSVQEEIAPPVTQTRQQPVSRNTARSRTPTRTTRSRTPTSIDVNPPVVRSFGQIKQLNPSTIPLGLGEDF